MNIKVRLERLGRGRCGGDFCRCDNPLLRIRPREEWPEYLGADGPRGCDNCGKQFNPNVQFIPEVILPAEGI